MTLISFDQFDLGLYLGGPRNKTPQGGWRQFKGAAPFSLGQFETRWGSSTVQSHANVHSIFEWEGSRYYGVGDDLYKDGSIVIQTFGLDGPPAPNPPRVHALTRSFRFFVAAPTPGQEDWLYVAGMGEGGTLDAPNGIELFQNLYKINSAGTVRRVGMEPTTGGGTVNQTGTTSPPAAGDYLFDAVGYASESELEGLPAGQFGGAPLRNYVRAGPFAFTANGTNDQELVLPTTGITDPQITKLNVYVSQLGGDVLYYAGETDVATSFVLTQIILNGLDTTRVLEPDHAPPGCLETLFPSVADQLDQWSDAVYHGGRSWWGRILSNGTDFPGQSGRVYFSKEGFPEYIQDFIQLSSDDEQVQRLMVFDGRLYCWSNEALYEIAGLSLDQAFAFQRIAGAPGTTAPDSLALSPGGIFYVGHDGFIWLFNGSSVEKVGAEALAPILWGQKGEENSALEHPSFDGLYGGYARDEYYISDGIRTYCVSTRTGRWRELGLGIDSLYFEAATSSVLAGLDSEVVLLEEEGVLLDGTARIPWAVQTPTVRSSPGTKGKILVLHIDAELNLTEATVTLVEEDREFTLGTITGDARQDFRLPLNRWTKDFAVRVEGEAFKRVRIFGISMDVQDSLAGQRR